MDGGPSHTSEGDGGPLAVDAEVDEADADDDDDYHAQQPRANSGLISSRLRGNRNAPRAWGAPSGAPPIPHPSLPNH